MNPIIALINKSGIPFEFSKNDTAVFTLEGVPKIVLYYEKNRWKLINKGNTQFYYSDKDCAFIEWIKRKFKKPLKKLELL